MHMLYIQKNYQKTFIFLNTYAVHILGQPEKLHIQLIHVKQRSNWDCGISCVLMVLPRKCKQGFLTSFTEICSNEGFDKR